MKRLTFTAAAILAIAGIWLTGTTAYANSTSNRITYVDGLGRASVKAEMWETLVTNTPGTACEVRIGINRNSTSAPPLRTSAGINNASGFSLWSNPSVTAVFTPSIGLNYLQAMEQDSSSSADCQIGIRNGLTATINGM